MTTRNPKRQVSDEHKLRAFLRIGLQIVRSQGQYPALITVMVRTGDIRGLLFSAYVVLPFSRKCMETFFD